MRKAGSILLAVCLLVISLTGCGGDAKTDAPATPSNGNSTLLSEITGETEPAAEPEAQEEAVPETAEAQAPAAAASPAADSGDGAARVYTDDAYISSLNLSDYLELADYNKAELTSVRDEITDEDLQGQIDYILDQYATYEPVKDRTEAVSGDRAVIDFTGRINGETFDGGSAEDYDLDIGSGRFIPGFEEGIIGHNTGETFDLNLTFPEQYAEQYAGKDVVFTVTLKELKERIVPELNDDFVAGLTVKDNDGNPITDTETFSDFIHAKMEELAQETYESDLKAEMVTWLEVNSEFKKDPPAAVVDRLKDRIADSYNNYAASYGMDLETMLTSMGMTMEIYEADVQDSALLLAKQLMLTNAVAEKEGITLTEEELNEALAEDAAAAGMSVEDFTASQDMRFYEEQLLGTMAVEALADRYIDQ